MFCTDTWSDLLKTEWKQHSAPQIYLDSDTYDGTALTNETVKAEGFVKDEGVTTHVNGSQTNAGSSKNTFAKPAYEAKAGTDLNNYKITTAEGTLTVNPVEKEVKVKITGHRMQ